MPNMHNKSCHPKLEIIALGKNIEKIVISSWFHFARIPNENRASTVGTFKCCCSIVVLADILIYGW